MEKHAMENPFQVKIHRVESEGKVVHTLHLSLSPDALFLRTKYRALIAHYHVVPEPVVFDLGKEMDLIKSVECYGPPMKLNTTCYGLRPDGLLELVFRNWGDPAVDGMPRV